MQSAWYTLLPESVRQSCEWLRYLRVAIECVSPSESEKPLKDNRPMPVGGSPVWELAVQTGIQNRPNDL